MRRRLHCPLPQLSQETLRELLCTQSRSHIHHRREGHWLVVSNGLPPATREGQYFHGTTLDRAVNIYNEGFRVGPGDKTGGHNTGLWCFSEGLSKAGRDHAIAKAKLSQGYLDANGWVNGWTCPVAVGFYRTPTLMTCFEELGTPPVTKCVLRQEENTMIPLHMDCIEIHIPLTIYENYRRLPGRLRSLLEGETRICRSIDDPRHSYNPYSILDAGIVTCGRVMSSEQLEGWTHSSGSRRLSCVQCAANTVAHLPFVTNNQSAQMQ